jgi:hypothetical protein
MHIKHTKYLPLVAGILLLHTRPVAAFSSPAACRGMASSGVQACKAMANGMANKGKLLVLGGTGFVGTELIRQALERGYNIVGLSRRGADSEAGKMFQGVDWRQGDASKEGVVSQILAEGGYTGVVHAIGMLLESDLNRFV